MNIILVAGLFITFLILLEIGYLVFRTVRNPERVAVRRRMNALSVPWDESESVDIQRKIIYSEIPWLNRILSKFPILNKMQRLLERSGLQQPLGVFILSSVLLFLLGILGGRLIIFNLLLLLPLAVFLGILPLLYVYYKKVERMKKFQAQLPEALDLLARSLKAGHAFTGGMRMVSDEFDDPIGVEFNKTLGEINLGVGVPEALKNLTNRVDCIDLNFFVTSIIIQRETGGNLAEILENIAYLIRERFKLYGKIRTLAAEGKISAYVLVGLPFFLAYFLYLQNPTYIATLITDPIGHVLIGIAVVLMIMGIFVMRKMIMIEV